VPSQKRQKIAENASKLNLKFQNINIKPSLLTLGFMKTLLKPKNTCNKHYFWNCLFR